VKISAPSPQRLRAPCHGRPAAPAREARPNDGSSGARDDGLGVPVPDIMVPVQFFAAFRHEAGIERERLLMLAVLADGVNCYRKYAFAHDPEGRQVFAETLEWVTSREGGHLFSFEGICDVLDIDAEHVRRALRRWYEQAQQARAGRRLRRPGRHQLVAQTRPGLDGHHAVPRDVIRVRSGARGCGTAHRDRAP
jgi:hypothetical protein